jgi:hypothetical protein
MVYASRKILDCINFRAQHQSGAWFRRNFNVRKYYAVGIFLGDCSRCVYDNELNTSERAPVATSLV